jgi:DnaJ-domain-containing protein 1
VGILKRLGEVTRDGLSELKQRMPGRTNKPLSELTDAELEEELLRRRRARAQRTGHRPERGREREADNPRLKQIGQYYANLELQPGASLEDVKRAYRELMKKFHPDRHAGDPERHKAATELAQSLTEAYKALTAYLEKKRDR